MKCVKCAREITTVQCPQCGYRHGKDNVYFLGEPNAKDLRIEFPDFQIENETLKKYKGTDLEVVVPEHVRKIGSGAFQGKKTIVRIKLPQAITEIQDHAFQDCSALREINLPDSVVFYGSGIFSGCTALRQVNVGGNQNTQFQMTFFDSNLERIDFRRGIRELNMDDLDLCSSLRYLKLPGSVQLIKRMLHRNRFGTVQVYAPERWKRKHSGFQDAFYRFADEPGTLQYVLHKPEVKRLKPYAIFAAVILTITFAIAGVVNYISANYIKSPVEGLLVAIDNIEPHPSGIPVQKIYKDYYCREETDGKYTYVKDAWREFDGKYYYFGEDGKMRIGGIWSMIGPEDEEWNFKVYGFHKKTGEMLTGEVSRELLTDVPVDEPYKINGESTFCFDENGVFQWEETISAPMEPHNLTLTWDDVSSQKSYMNFKYSDDPEKRYWLAEYDLPVDDTYRYISCEASNITLTKGQPDKGWGLFIYCSPSDGEDWDWICLVNPSYDPETGKVTAEAEIPEDCGYVGGCMLVYGGIPWGAECSFDMTVTKVVRQETDDFQCSIEKKW